MSTKAIFIVLIIALALAGATYFVMTPRKPARTPAPVGWLAGLAEGDAAIQGLSVEWPGGEKAEISRTPHTGDWLVRLGGAKGSAAWPIGMGQLRGALRLLAEQAGAEHATGAFNGDGARVTIRPRDGAARTLAFSSETLAGRARARTDDGPGATTLIIDARVRDLFTREGLLAWRKGNAFPREGLDPTRIIVETPGGRYTLASLLGSWGLQRPVAAPASREQVAKLKERLGALTFTRILDADPEDPAMGFASAWAIVGIETPLRGASDGAPRRVLVESLRVGSAADVAGTTRFVRAGARLIDPDTRQEHELWGPIAGVMEASKIEALAMGGAALVSRRSTPTAMADVSAIELTPLSGFEDAGTPIAPPSARERARFRLGVAGWERARGESSTELSAEESAEVAGFVKMLADIDASEVSLTPTGSAIPLARASVQGGAAKDATIVLIGALPASEGKEAALLTRVGGVDRVYRGPWVAGLARWLAKAVEPEG